MFETKMVKLEDKKVLLDGVHNGIAAWLYNESRYVEDSNGNYLFPNYKVLESIILSKGINKISYDIVFVLEDGSTFNINQLHYNEYFNSYDAHIVNFKKFNEYDLSLVETKTDTINSIGYFVTNESDRKTKSKSDALNKQKTLMNIIINCAQNMCTYPYYGIYIKESKEGFLVIGFNGCSGTIVFNTNDSLISINESRKANQKRVIPFSKEMDKFGTIHCYCALDKADREENKDRVYNMLMSLLLYAQKCFPDMEISFKEVTYRGWIEV